jgi:hypothetical protein
MTVYRHRIIGHGVNAELWNTTLHTESSTGLGDASTAMYDFLDAIGTGPLAARWSTGVAIESFVTDQLDDDTGDNVNQNGVAGLGWAGTAVDKPHSPRDCVVISLKTALPTRRGHGRMFWPAPTVASTDANGKLTNAAAVEFADEFGAALTTLAATTRPVVYHRAVKAPLTIPRTIPRPILVTPTWTVITSLGVGDRLGTQTRRNNQTANTYSPHAV